MRRRLACLSIALLAALSACREAKITRYRVPKEAAEDATPSAPGPTMASTSVPTAAGADLAWTAPAHWQAKAASAMRKGSYSIPGDAGADGDVSITAFPGDVGGELANINRWRGQIQLPPLVASDLAAATTRFDHLGLRFAVVDFANTAEDKPVRVLGAIVPHGDATWFFKLTGPDALVAREKPAFLAFLQTIRAPAPSAP